MHSTWKAPFFHVTISGLTGLAIALLGSLGIRSRLQCEWWDATCVETVGQNARYYLSKEKEIWWEVLFTMAILMPISTAPYMVVECLRTYRIRFSDLLESVADATLVYFNCGRYASIPIMFALVLLRADTGSISRVGDLGKEMVFNYKPSSLAERIEQRATGLCKKSDLNFDIVGPGVRLSTYVLLIFTVISLTIGSLHTGTLGTKELGICTLLNLFGTAFNVIKLKKSSLTPTEMLVAIALIDAQIVSLVATLSSKDVLASRWYVRLTIACVITAWVSVAVLGHRLKKPETYIEDSICCVRPSWTYWAPGHRQCDFAMYLAIIFPYYWYSHGFDLAHTLWLAYYHTRVFDSLEKLDQRDDHRRPAHADVFSLLPATAFSAWRSSFFHPFLVVIAIERHLAAVDQTNLAEWQAWGQSLTLCVCIGGLFHWFYVNRELILYTITRGRYGVWPSTQCMFPTDIARSVAMGLQEPYLGSEDRQLLATGIVRTDRPIADILTAGDPSSQPGEVFGTTRPVATRMISADVGDQVLVEVLDTSTAESSSQPIPEATRPTITSVGSGDGGDRYSLRVRDTSRAKSFPSSAFNRNS